MKIAKKLPILRVEDSIINLEYLTTAWYDTASAAQGHYSVFFRIFNDTNNYLITFKTKKAALEALDQIMLAIDIPIIEEDES